MLSRYQQQANNNSFNVRHVDSHISASQNRLTLSYDLNNYHPLLQHLQSSDDPRWILFIAPPGKPNVQFLQQAGINKSRIITLNQKQLNDPDQLFKDALASNNYAAVIRWVTKCNKPLMNEINQLTDDSNTHCFVYCAQ
jgi:cell division inhibitor SulA